MLNNRFIISGLIINALAACSSPMELPQPKGDWIDFESPSVMPVATADKSSNKTNTTPASQFSINSAYQPALAKTAGAVDKERFVTASGKNVPLYSAVRTIVPSSWNVKLSPDVSANFRGALSWTGNDQWPYVLRKSLSAAGLTSVIDEQRKEVIVSFAAPAKPEMQKLTPSKPTKTTTAPVQKIFSVGVLSPPVVPVVTPPFKQPPDKKPLLEAPIPAKPMIPVKPAVRSWTIKKGSTLRKAFEQWVSGDKCSGPNGKWELRWETETDYPIDDPLSFTSVSFEDVSNQLFSLYRNAKVPLYVHGFRPQCLIIVNEQK